jgi:hypothetical protein
MKIESWILAQFEHTRAAIASRESLLHRSQQLGTSKNDFLSPQGTRRVLSIVFNLRMHQSGAVNPASGLRFTGQTFAFPGQPVLDHAIRTLQELSAGNVHHMSAISSALLKWATVFQRVAGDVSDLFCMVN